MTQDQILIIVYGMCLVLACLAFLCNLRTLKANRKARALFMIRIEEERLKLYECMGDGVKIAEQELILEKANKSFEKKYGARDAT